MHTQDAFLEHIGKNPSDHEAKRIFADWLEEHGDPACEAWRWLAENERTPRAFAEWANDLGMPPVARLYAAERKGFFWAYYDTEYTRLCWLPVELCRAMERQGRAVPVLPEFETVRSAYLAAVAAFLAAKANGWRPPWPEKSAAGS